GPAERRNQVRAHRAQVGVKHHGRNTVHVQTERVSEQHQLQSPLRQGGHQAARIANDLQQLFASHRTGAPKVHFDTVARSCSSINPTNTSSMDGGIGSREPILIPAALSADWISGIARASPSTLMCSPLPKTATSTMARCP